MIWNSGRNFLCSFCTVFCNKSYKNPKIWYPKNVCTKIFKSIQHMTNLSHLAPISKHFENGNCVKKNTDRLQKIKTIKSTNNKSTNNEKKTCDEKTKNSSKLIAKIKELQLTESSQFADHLFLSHKRKLIQLVENETNLHSIMLLHVG